MAKKLTRFILIALVLGIITGWAINANGDALRNLFVKLGWVSAQTDTPTFLKELAGYLSIVTALVPAPDQDDHRAAGVLDPGRRASRTWATSPRWAGSACARSAGSLAPAWSR